MQVNNFLYPQNTYINSRNKRKNKNISFEKSCVNIWALADGHGNLLKKMAAIYEIIIKRFNVIFYEADAPSTLNILSIGGDESINGAKKGFLSVPDKCLGEVLFDFQIKLISSIRKLFKTRNNEATILLGNHDCEGGALWMLDKLKNEQKIITPIITNAEVPSEYGVFKQKIYSVKDDSMNFKYNILDLEVIAPNMKFYVSEDHLKGIKIIDSCNKSDTKLTEQDLTNTVETLGKIVEDFKSKKENENGAVIIKTHAAELLSDMIAEKIPGITLILNAHVHKNGQKEVNDVPIIFLGENNSLFKSVRLILNPSGKHSIETLTFFTKNIQPSENNPLNLYTKSYLEKDLLPKLKINGRDLGLEDIRWQHNVLANFMTTEAIHTYYPELDAVGVTSTTFRGEGLKNGDNNLSIMNLLDGCREDLSEICVAEMNGSSLLKILAKNLRFNLENPQRNALIQWSGIKIDKRDKTFQILREKAPGTKEYEDIDLDKSYKIALPLKYVQKYCPPELKELFKPTGKTLNNLFMKYLKEKNYEITIREDILKERVIS